MDISTWTLYFIAVLILTVSPGPSALFCMSKAITSGKRSGIYAALGSLTAITLILSLSFTGLGVIIATSELAFNIIKWLGASYLIYLGIKALLSKSTGFALTDIPDKNNQQSMQHFISGFTIGASNPKAIVFFTALFPQFINPGESLLTQYLIFSGTFILLELTWLLFYVMLGVKSSKWLFEKGRTAFFNKLSGSVFIGAGALLSMSNRSE
ncbi:LysE family translocator [Pseudoalteromonas sp. G4]|uniref:LysE family translocator n=1 Tax=Pseudoalteromonas sp. G4 TaxID=2992761 RepID=UPI00237E396E|nr:LysE family translocator [Pseudoalteromonas sp. G4]MDE3271426.1 LysE family translocator [Pseudoalteromonas sp. G4]